MRVALAALLFSSPTCCCSTSRRTISISRRPCGSSPSSNPIARASSWSATSATCSTVVDHILHLDRGKVTLYPGDYDAFVKQRAEREAQTEPRAPRRKRRPRSCKAYVDRWRYKAHTARQAQSRLKALAKMQPIAASAEDASVVFDFPSPKELRPPLIVLDDAAVGYAADTPVLSRLNLRIDPDDRIALVGRNGNGKTTLARLLAGQLPPMSGRSLAAANCASAISPSIRSRSLCRDDTPLQHMERLLAGAKPGEVRAQLGRFGFSGDKANVAVRQLLGRRAGAACRSR